MLVPQQISQTADVVIVLAGNLAPADQTESSASLANSICSASGETLPAGAGTGFAPGAHSIACAVILAAICATATEEGRHGCYCCPFPEVWFIRCCYASRTSFRLHAHTALRVIPYWQHHVQEKQRKADLAATAVCFQRYGSSGAAMLAVLALHCIAHTALRVTPYWQHHVQRQQRKADMAAVKFQRYASLGAAMLAILPLQYMHTQQSVCQHLGSTMCNSGRGRQTWLLLLSVSRGMVHQVLLF